jgi:hypothetical protein
MFITVDTDIVCNCLQNNTLTFQCEGRVTKLRDEDTRMLKILSKQRAQRNWDKVSMSRSNDEHCMSPSTFFVIR